jgi:hypothetical protein
LANLALSTLLNLKRLNVSYWLEKQNYLKNSIPVVLAQAPIMLVLIA